MSFSTDIKEEICELSNYQEFGARKIKKIIKDELENIIIDNILNKNTKNINIKKLRQESPV